MVDYKIVCFDTDTVEFRSFEFDCPTKEEKFTAEMEKHGWVVFEKDVDVCPTTCIVVTYIRRKNELQGN